MKKNFFNVPAKNTRFIHLHHGPDDTHRAEQVDSKNQNADKPKDHKAIAKKGLKGIGKNLQNVKKLSPDAAKLVGKKMPQALAGNINNPNDIKKLRNAVSNARKNIEDQMPKPGEKPENKESELKGKNEKPEMSPEAIQESLEWVEAVEAKLAEAGDSVAEDLKKDPENEQLKATASNLKNVQKDVGRFHQDIKIDVKKVETYASQGGEVGTLAQKVAQVAKGEVGQATNDAQGNAKYTPGGVNQPWCADFVNHVVENAGGKGTGSSMAKSFVGGEGKGHCGIVAEGDTTLEGNKGDKVAQGSVGNFSQAISPEDVGTGHGVKSASQAKKGDIVVKSRDDSNTNEA